MRVMLAAVGVAALTLLMTQAAAQTGGADHSSCNPFSAQIVGARGDRATLEALLRSTPGHCTRTRAAIQAAMPLPPRPPAPQPLPPVAPPVRISPPTPPPRITSLDARTTPSSIRAPLVSNPANLPDYALFRECDGCPEMVVMPAGSFTMGSPATDARRASAEGPQRNVSIRRFAISRFETTWDEWTACVNAGGCNQGPIDTLIGQQTWARDASNWGRGQRPAIMVDWNDAAAYAIFVRSRAGGASYRLPTESEWEYAARAGTSTRWSFRDAESQLGAYAWFSGNSNSRTQPVGGKAANPWGLFDMHGNVWEWVEDCYNDSLANTPTNGAANTTGSCSYRVNRGGSWYDYPLVLRSASRSGSAPANRLDYLGFRLSRTL